MAGLRICSVGGCDKPDYKRGFCSSHHHRWLRYGDPLKGGKYRNRIPVACSVDGCVKPASSRGWCIAHYTRWRNHGDLTVNLGKGKCLHWLLEQVDHRDNECLIWPFARNKKTGHGKIRFRNIDTSASRAMCFLAHGEPPTQKHQAAHECGKGYEGCVNPLHLRWALPFENQQDHLKHGTRRILSLAQKEQIRALAGTMRQTEIAKRFGFAASTIAHFLRGTRAPKYR